jgi:hypothetical protein
MASFAKRKSSPMSKVAVVTVAEVIRWKDVTRLVEKDEGAEKLPWMRRQVGWRGVDGWIREESRRDRDGLHNAPDSTRANTESNTNTVIFFFFDTLSNVLAAKDGGLASEGGACLF